MKFISPILLLLLVACSPVYESYFSYSGPNTAEGRHCVSQCQNSQLQCRQACGAGTQSCMNNVLLEAQRDYEIYVLRQQAAGRPIQRSADSFRDDWRCQGIEGNCRQQCVLDYNACFANCGGTVTEQRVCTAFCD